ncbi:MAG TPA: penicillin-binding protein 2 [Candidatus Sulfotelmatobacter sp.]|jgi:penicillin-binding protein 2|nr:penicillin-binding protein 2 [Candidatus Sulfotelmatobacter sp.]
MFGRDEKVSAIRLTAAQYMILGIFLVLAYGLWRLQVMQSDYYSLAAEKNRLRNVPVLAPRGKILDREGRTIVDNYPSFSALLLRDSSRDLTADADLIAQGLHLDPKEVRARIRRFAAMPQYQPIFLKEDITPDELQFIEAHRNELPELDTIMSHRRLYPRNGFMAHLIGYVGEVSEDMLNQSQFDLFNAGDVVGISGVERQYNSMLMGKNGSRQALVDSHGREVGRLGETEAEPGKQLKLTVDIDLQIAAEEALEGKNGAIVAMDPRTGEILAMVSGPTFDPNDFAVHVSRDQWNKLVTDPDKPLLNKAIQAQLAPGSTFKIIMATAGLQENIAQDMHVVCNGGGEFYGRYFKCWISARHQSHGVVDIYKGVYQSCDVFFYTLAEKLGIDRIAKYATMLGLGQKTGIDLPQEASGVMPSEEWKIRNFKQKWFAGETISVGIGQGAVAVTPIQMARAFAAIASGGKMVRPHVTNPSDLPPGVIQASDVPDAVTIPIDPKNWEIVTDAMAQVVSPVGTAALSQIKGVDMAGKTGSAQTISNMLKAKMSAAEKALHKDNGWFVGVEPRRNPEIVVCGLYEEGEHGDKTARVVAQVIKAFVEKQRRQPAKMADKPKPDGKVEIGAVWTTPGTDGDKEKLQAGHFFMDVTKNSVPLATVAPGISQ